MRRSLSIVCSILWYAAMLVAAPITPANDIPQYYADLDGLADKSLFDQVHVISTQGYRSLGYDGLWNAYYDTDIREDGTIWDMYSHCDMTISGDKCGQYTKECDCVNREHSIPKSWFGGTKSNAGCDIFHVVPTDGYVNGRRGNYPFGEVASASYTSKNGSKLGASKTLSISGITIVGDNGVSASCSGNVFEPIDEYKGDFARGYMGTMIRWAGDFTAFTQSNGNSTFSGNYTASGYFGLSKYGVALLLKWHRQDPVSQKEIDRNNGIQKTQGNRNPFIDYPYLAEYIWGEKAGEVVDLEYMIPSTDSRFVPGESNGAIDGGGGIVPEDKYQVVWMVDGKPYMEGEPTYEVAEGKRVTTLPIAPASCSEESEQFVGWSEVQIEGTQDEVPIDLFSTAADAPYIYNDVTYHAVFAHVEQIGEGQAETLTLSKENKNGWVISGTEFGSSYCKLTAGAYIESSEINLSALQEIVINARTYGGGQYNTIDITCNGQTLGKVEAQSKELQDYSWIPENTLSGMGKIRFSSTTNGGSNDGAPAVGRIDIHSTGIGYMYSRYITTCNPNTATDITTSEKNLIAKKLIINGEMLIEFNGILYDILGNRR